MKKGDKFVLLALLFVALMIIATMGYRSLSEQYMPQGIDRPIEYEGTASDSAENTSSADSTEQITGSTSSAGSTEQTVASTLAPDFTVLDVDGNSVKLSDFFGKPIIINFWATWCGPCKSELPAFDNMYAKYGDEVHFIMLNLTDGSRDTVESVNAFVSDGGYTFPVYFDTTMEAAYTYGAYSIPMTVLINADGQLVHSQMGAMAESTLEQYIQTLIEISKEEPTTE